MAMRRKPSRGLRLAPALGLVLATLAVLGPATSAAAKDVGVSMKEFMFMPMDVTVDVGDTVVWTYDESSTDPVPNCESPYLQLGIPGVTCPGHSTTSDAKDGSGKRLWDSGVHRAGGFPFRHRFTKPGTYRYFCTVHGGANPNNPITMMNGTVVVRGQSPSVLNKRIISTKRPAVAATGANVRAITTLALLLISAGAALWCGDALVLRRR